MVTLEVACILCLTSVVFRFCLQHVMPEVHGCGDEVKAAARLQWEMEALKAKERDVNMHVGTVCCTLRKKLSA